METKTPESIASTSTPLEVIVAEVSRADYVHRVEGQQITLPHLGFISAALALEAMKQRQGTAGNWLIVKLLSKEDLATFRALTLRQIRELKSGWQKHAGITFGKIFGLMAFCEQQTSALHADAIKILGLTGGLAEWLNGERSWRQREDDLWYLMLRIDSVLKASIQGHAILWSEEAEGIRILYNIMTRYFYGKEWKPEMEWESPIPPPRPEAPPSKEELKQIDEKRAAQSAEVTPEMIEAFKRNALKH